MGFGSGGERLAYAYGGPDPATMTLALHTTKGTLGSGRSLAENIKEASAIVPLSSSGKFASKSKSGRRNVRVFESDDAVRSAYEFVQKAGKGFVSMSTIPEKGYIMRMADGALITYRYASSSPDRSPVVELTAGKASGVKSQKIHFVKRSSR